MNYKDKFEKRVVYSIDAFDLDEILQEEYNKNFETILDQDNHSTLKIKVDGQFSKWDEKELESYESTGNQQYNTLRLLLNNLCRQGKIEAGDYLISIS